MLGIQRFFLNNPLRNYNYVIRNPQGAALIIDPTQADLTIHYVERQGLTPDAIWITHEDQDHIGGAVEVSAYFNVPIFAPKAFSHLLKGAAGFSESDILSFAGARFTTKHLPGHTPHHHVFYCRAQKLLISGDMLFNYGIGKVRHAQHENMYKSIRWLAGLPDDTTFLTAHDYDLIGLRFALSLQPDNEELNTKLSQLEPLKPEQRPLSTIGEQRKLCPYFQLDNAAIIRALQKKGMPVDTPFAVFKSIRLLRDEF
ncbi:MBL fold metallo-hydrolase [Gilvimarinus sp. SDUM040013]|uniref:hydroxyacylglutathione hydrolase n=1 Tax=Gilvimarinus gilvus TaxID=3058038 RepID=A0ABU4S130_9GAMM|nr:MBL fold metallo-hydrolase [Gilvimarinus sp. SDUM040013]MDO3384795.1 MBL fold metallo-hydrolase [Gilvimarinus sp. SDUM040013]MDX6850872.1 MBL fold metallo-hydrolase [Gilvimarinus sp. SDUM040013]